MVGYQVLSKPETLAIACTKVRRLRSGPALVAAAANNRIAWHHPASGPCASRCADFLPGGMPGYALNQSVQQLRVPGLYPPWLTGRSSSEAPSVSAVIPS